MPAVEGPLLVLWLLRADTSAESIHGSHRPERLPERIACALVRARIARHGKRVSALPAIIAGAVLLRLISGVGFANYDTLYALAWGGQLSRGVAPAYRVAIAPTPHPLIELLGLVLSPLGPRAVENVTVWLGFLALSACGWVLYRLGSSGSGGQPELWRR